MTVLKAIPPIQIHPVLLFFLLTAYFTGAFMEFAILLVIVFIHEMGHVLMAVHLKWRIEKIMIWIFGGVMQTAEHGNRPITEEALVIVAGPFQHVLIYVFLTVFGGSFLPESVVQAAYTANTMLLLFNLLPIWPLDGGKLLSLVLASLMPYRKAHTWTVILSVVMGAAMLAIQLIYYPFALSAFCLIVFLLLENRTEWKQRYFAFIRFLLKRFEVPKYKLQSLEAHSNETIISILSRFRRNRRHVVCVTYEEMEHRIKETELLEFHFKGSTHKKTMEDLLRKRN